MPSPTQGSDSSDRYVIPNLRNACRILKRLGLEPEGMKAADLSRELGIPVTTTLRIMTTLHLEGLVRKSEGRFELGPVLIQLGNVALTRTEIRDQALPLLKELSEKTDETAHLAIPCDQRSLIVAVHNSPHPLRASSSPGFLAELHCSSTGKIFLAFNYRDRIAQVLPEFPLARRTPATLVDLVSLEAEVDATRSRGYSLDNEEFHPGVRCLAAPVFSAAGNVEAAIGITAPSVRFPPSRTDELAALVCETARKLSHLLGYNEPASGSSG